MNIIKEEVLSYEWVCECEWPWAEFGYGCAAAAGACILLAALIKVVCYRKKSASKDFSYAMDNFVVE